jgi:hypothetical protein
MLIPPPIEHALASVESIFSDVSAALISGEPVALLSASAALKQATLDCAQLMQRLTPADLKNPILKLRLKTIADGLAVRRESLIRRTVLVERALNAVVPATRNTTYAKAAGPYGTAGKQSGSFKYLSA